MESITFGILTISDRCARNEYVDESGPNLMKLITNGIVSNGTVSITDVVPDSVGKIQKKIKQWCDDFKVNVILTAGGTGPSETDVTPEATKPLLDKILPGIPLLIFKKSSQITPLAALSRGICGLRGKTLIVNLPGSKKASQECFEAIAEVIEHAVDLIRDNQPGVKYLHSKIKTELGHSKLDPSDITRRSRQSEYRMQSVAEAQELIIEIVKHYNDDLVKTKTISLQEASGYSLAHNIFARDPLPPYPASIKDGYAVIADDQLTTKKVLGSLLAGDCNPSEIHVTPGSCARVSTGAYIPFGADAVVQVEDTELISTTEDGREELQVKFHKLAQRGQDIRETGSDISIGELVLKKNTYLGPCEIGVLATVGVKNVLVYCKPKVGILSTGNELQDPMEDLTFGKIRDSNRITLINLLKENGFSSRDLGIAADSPDQLYKTLKDGFEKTDILITSGSVSMGEKDFLKHVLIHDFDAELHFGRIHMKPGKPTSFASLKYNERTKLWFGLPGNPVSAVVTSMLFVLPAVKQISGYSNCFPRRIKAIINENINLDERPEYRRAILSYTEDKTCVREIPLAHITGNQISSRLTNCVNANCLLELPASSKSCSKLQKGSVVDALLMNIL